MYFEDMDIFVKQRQCNEEETEINRFDLIVISLDEELT